VFKWTIIKVLSVTVNNTNKNNKGMDTKMLVVKAIQSKFSRIDIIGLMSFKIIMVKNQTN
jgi:hypothetical protein